MFEGCTSLTFAPELSATTLKGYCYSSMFQGCTSLTSAPALPGTTLATCCYGNMFKGCTSLTAAPELPATTLEYGCYQYMFEGCTSLTSAPALPGTTLANYCYTRMFRGCSSLATAPALPATILANNCYFGMFYGCTNLTTAPALPGTTLANNCYEHMFYGCTNLTTAPALPATTLTTCCYYGMFYNCTKLNYIKMLATDISADNCLTDWVNRVASSGTFVKHKDMNSLPSGQSGIPTGWNVVDVDEEESGVFYCNCISIDNFTPTRIYTFKLNNGALWNDYIGQYDVTNTVYIKNTNIGICIVLDEDLLVHWYPVDNGGVSPNDSIIPGNTYECVEY